MKKIFYVMALGIYLISLNAQGQLTTGIEEYYNFDEASEITLEPVSSNHGLVSQSTQRAPSGKIGGAYFFDGNDDYITLTTPITKKVATYSFWINITSIPVNEDLNILANGAYDSRIFIGASNNIKFETNTNGEEVPFYTSFNMSTWYHVVITRNNDVVKFYRDGSLKGSSSFSSSGADFLTISQIGFNGRSFRGTIDEVGIWSRELSVSEISQLYNTGTGVAYPFAANVAVTGVTLSPTSASIAVGGTQQLTPIVAPSNATNKTVNYSSSNTAVATVNASGVVTGVAAGTATITVTTVDQAKTATCAITVTTVAINGVTVSPSTAPLTVGGTQQLSATVAPANANQSVIWTTSQSTIATVSTSGVVTAVAIGTATITATSIDASKKATCTVTVTAATSQWQMGTGGAIYYNGGKVGIGTTNPLNKLHIEGSAEGTDRYFINLKNTSTSTSSFTGINLLAGNSGNSGFLSFTSSTYNTAGFGDCLFMGSYGSNGIRVHSKNGPIVFYTNVDGSNTALSRVTIGLDGKVGIGTTTPTDALDIHFPNLTEIPAIRLSRIKDNQGGPIKYTWRINVAANGSENGYMVDKLVFQAGVNSLEDAAWLSHGGIFYCAELRDKANTNFYVNPSSTNTSIRVAGGIVAKRIDIMDPVPQSDFVFDQSYDLKNLEEVESFIMQHKHLPEVPSAEEFKANGYSVGEMDDILLRKVEELTLYMIEQQKQIKALKQEVETLKATK